MLKNIKTILKDDSGAAALFEGVAVLLTALASVALIFTIANVAVRASTLNSAAKEIAENIAADGEYTSTEKSEAATYLTNNGLKNVTITCDCSGKIQYGTSFTITLSYPTSIGIGGIGSTTLTLPAKHTAVSNVYWK